MRLKVKTWNVLIPVVALVDAEDEDEATMKLATALGRAGFDTCEPNEWDAFESEEGTEENLYVPVSGKAVPASEYMWPKRGVSSHGQAEGG